MEQAKTYTKRENARRAGVAAGVPAELVRQTHFTSAEHLRSTLDNYCKVYNHHTPQKALGFISPVDALKQWYAKQPELFNKKIYKQAELDMICQNPARNELQDN